MKKLVKYDTKKLLNITIVCEAVITVVSIFVIFIAKDEASNIQNMIEIVCEVIFSIFAVIICYLSIKLRCEKAKHKD